MKKYVLTGGPGIGKTTLIEIIASIGYEVVPEAARIIIEEEQFKNSDALPWKDLEKFQELVVRKQLEEENKIKGFPAFLDRSIIDGYGYSKLGGATPSSLIADNANGRYDKVFILEPLENYQKDSVRLENEEESRKIHQAIIDAYSFFGYDLIFVPVMSPDDRVKFILDHIV